MVVTLRDITDENRDAIDYPHANPWYRAVYQDDEPVGFVMLSWTSPTGDVDNNGEVIVRLVLTPT